jgi:hypothetical protein
MKIAAENPAQQRKQIATLAVLVIVAAVLLYYQFGGQPAAATAEPGARASNTAVAQGAPVPAGALPEPLKLALLEPVPEQVGEGRNPFGFGVPPRPPVPPPPPYVAPPPVQAPIPEPPPGPPPRPKIPVKFLGVAEDPARPGKLVSLAINGIVILAREGDVVDGRYRLLKIGTETIVMAYLDGQGQETIRQSGT